MLLLLIELTTLFPELVGEFVFVELVIDKFVDDEFKLRVGLVDDLFGFVEVGLEVEQVVDRGDGVFLMEGFVLVLEGDLTISSAGPVAG